MNYILYYDLLMNDILYKNVTLWPHNDLIMITSWYNNLGKGKAMTRKISYKAIYHLLLLKTNCHQTCFPKEHFKSLFIHIFLTCATHILRITCNWKVDIFVHPFIRSLTCIEQVLLRNNETKHCLFTTCICNFL